MDKKIVAFGDTYPIRSRLKFLGAIWSSSQKAWFLEHTPENVEGLMAIGFCPAQSSQDRGVESTKNTEVDGGLPEFSVQSLFKLVNKTIQSSIPPQFWILAQIENVRVSRGHTWLELAEQADPSSKDTLQEFSLKPVKKRASVHAVLWKGTRQLLERKPGEQPLPLEEGLGVRLLGHLDLHQEGTRLQLIVDDVDTQYTQGQLALSKEQILAELKKRGLADRNRQTVLSLFPLRIALITAQESRAQNDFLHEISLTGISFTVTLFDCRMQGEATAPDVIRSLQAVNTAQGSENHSQSKFDVVVITRGGGSRMDLRWFDDLEMAKAIAYCTLPVVTAIGHHDDRSVADAVSFHAEKTPTGAAQFLGQHCLASLDHLLGRAAACSQSAIKQIERTRAMVDQVYKSIGKAAQARVQQCRVELGHKESLLAVLKTQMMQPLDRGFALLYKEETGHSKKTPLTAEDFLSPHPPEKALIKMRSTTQSQDLILEVSIRNITTTNPKEEEKHSDTSIP